ncbi:hypothetical protein RJQ12_30945, partial [Paenibacillus taichungensis]
CGCIRPSRICTHRTAGLVLTTAVPHHLTRTCMQVAQTHRTSAGNGLVGLSFQMKDHFVAGRFDMPIPPEYGRIFLYA